MKNEAAIPSQFAPAQFTPYRAFSSGFNAFSVGLVPVRALARNAGISSGVIVIPSCSNTGGSAKLSKVLIRNCASVVCSSSSLV
ncbi:MAG: hypothetical protein BWZ09_02337 [Alphaproteobacteria bacterium ADurb.BinA305]|nr:MAG: hypothetical protein BWZ09_02337 [Alphaproteobacteria bacterium ADurb.BinA305]